MKRIARTTVGRYLAKRLEQIGLKHIFGVPGDYVLGLFDILERSAVKVVCNCNELNAGYAADAYARLNGVGGVCVTYGVGGFSLLNAAVGAHAERLPLIVMSGAPRIAERSHHHLLHHTIGDMNLQFNIYEKITAAAVTLTSPQQAPRQIDDALEACLRYKRPVYIEMPMDIVSMPCVEPCALTIDTGIPTCGAALDEAVAEAVRLLQAARRPVIIAGVEPHRFRIQKELQAFIDHSGYPFASTLLGKTVISEEHPQFIGVYSGAASRESARQAVEKADLILCLGTLMTDIALGDAKTLTSFGRMIAANSDNVRIKHHIYNNVGLKDFIVALTAKLKKGKPVKAGRAHPSGVLKEKYAPVPRRKMTIKRFYQRINRFIKKGDLVIADTGDSIFNLANLFLPFGVDCIDQAFYLSIGYSVPATLGAKLARPDLRPVVFVGDGAFQMTVQELSTLIREKTDPVIFLMNNSGYTIERVLQDGTYNDLQMWNYADLPAVFGGGWGCVVRTEDELEDALAQAQTRAGELALIEVQTDPMDCSDNLKKLKAALNPE
jgi:indolepyruvate decarboxylase